MNFNLISPTTNGNDFTINFKDPIKIGANSKLQLNWVELKRLEVIVLTEDQTIEIASGFNNTLGVSLGEMLPTTIPATNADNKLEITVTIPKGTYTIPDLQFEIEEKISDALITANKFRRVDNNDAIQAYQPLGIDGRNQTDVSQALRNDGVLGLCLNSINYREPTIDTTNSHDSATTTSGGDDVAYTTANNTGQFDNYANFFEHFSFYRDNCPNDQNTMNSFARFRSINTIDSQTGKLFFGVTGLEYTDGIGGAPPTRTNGNNPPVTHNGVPATFIGVECGDATGDFIIYIARSATQDIPEWTNQNQAITGMHVVQRLPVSTTFNTSKPYDLLFGMEINNQITASTTEPEIRWKVATYQEGSYQELYDSNSARRNLPYELLKATDGAITYDNATAINSQIPFGFQVSATNADEGWEDIRYAVLDKTMPNHDTNPASILRSYTIGLSEELANIYNVTPSPIPRLAILQPNGCQESVIAQGQAILADLDVNWKSQNYSIFINLPTNNYKNVSQTNSRDGGFKKSILANIPSPFTTGTIFTNQGGDSGSVVSIYQPYQPIVSSLKNNEISTNTLSIKIVDMDTEKPATSVIRSVVNFTITDE